MVRSKKPIRVTSGKFFFLSIATFTSVGINEHLYDKLILSNFFLGLEIILVVLRCAK